jgi:hypothetical protein
LGAANVFLDENSGRFPIPVKNLTPGTICIFQARVFNNLGLTDWSDPVSLMAT